ncbi:hypothetical protein G6011_07344 [Alternaria panax]|uniref:Heterokaryon incompatibility domain-containing protein n=1 Tax=Alternaria panax TaxID=48097 RepID=A0AAD4I9F6_9PLEO|nr:hypothetical protein G6011_07344 [Alternaria panax]
MTDFLTAVSTRKVKGSELLIQEVRSLNVQEDAVSVNSIESALEALKNQPSRTTVSNVLNYLTTDGFSLLLPEPLNASIAHQLINDTIPNYWGAIKGSAEVSKLKKILRNPTSLGHLNTRLRSLIADSRQKKAPGEARNTAEHIADTLEILYFILSGHETSHRVLQDVLVYGKNSAQRKLIWREYLVQVASGRLLSIAAEAEDVLKKSDEISRDASWVADGKEYAAWLGHNIAVLLQHDPKSEEYLIAVLELCSKALGLGYTDRITSSLLKALLDSGSVGSLTIFLSQMKTFEQRKYLNAIVVFVAKEYFSSETISKDDAPIVANITISSIAALFHTLIKDNDVLKEHIVSSLTRSTIPALDESLSARRSVLAALAKDDEKLHTLLENLIRTFGDSVYIRHTPVLQQEALAQTLALCSGYVKRTQPMFLTMMAKSTYHVNGMSNRIGAASTRARFLGIAVGVAISKMVDKPELQLKFELEGAEAEEASWYQRLTEVGDEIGQVADLKAKCDTTAATRKAQSKPKSTPKVSKAPAITEIQGPRVVEVMSDSEDEDADLMVYEKPDSDPEDDTDDATAINRNKPIAPVYIRDLIAGLRDQENYDRHELALATAAPLIRRKANFGTEVTDHLEELATLLTGLQDNSELEGFVQQRQQALIAVLLAKPAQMAQWFARSFFLGDYSLEQRIAMLTTLGLGARELAGMKDTTTHDLVPAKPDFPSKQLPPHLHKIYAEENHTPTVAKISSSMAREMLSPLASQAADQLSGPNILKVRTFSSRMEVEKKRHKPTPNALAQIVADNFFFPLTGRWWLQIRANSDSMYASTHLLPPFLQTLSLLLNASGPNTLALPQMTREYWDLLLSVRGLAGKDKNILNAVLFGFLMLLETNENKERVATEQGKELMETQAWVRMVFEGLDPRAQVIPRKKTSNNVLETAQAWMTRCKCARSWDVPGERWYPRRLLDLQELRANIRDPRKARIRLVESAECPGLQTKSSGSHCVRSRRQDDRYVTLSHCWGKPRDGVIPLRLTFETERRFKTEGITLQELPKTFRDAVVFASRLDKVGFIWIDSLCIRQPLSRSEEQLKDWFEQGRCMGTVYQQGFLNISATASSDGNGGLFFDPRPAHSSDNIVDVYYEERPFVSKKVPTAELDAYTRCTVIEESVWENLVESAPVNRRAWVFQERLLAPRVLHFGYNQLAWECCEFQSSEDHSDEQLDIARTKRLKHLTPDIGRTLRDVRLKGSPDPDLHLRDLYSYELWKMVVEMYSRTQLTKFEDKLIALAGVARLFQESLFKLVSRQQYIAGLWSTHLESQLLWSVNEVYKTNGVFDNPARRHPESGPSFSWASIDSPHGIIYSDVTDYKSSSDTAGELIFKVVDHSIELADPKNPFGMVTTGRLLLAPRHLRRIDLYKLPVSRRVPFAWRLKIEPQPKRPKEFTNIYLDAPESDVDIFRADAQMYCMPAAYGERMVIKKKRYLYCLLLKYEGSVPFMSNGKSGRYRAFRRVGIAKLGDYDEQGQNAMKEESTKEIICLC